MKGKTMSEREICDDCGEYEDECRCGPLRNRIAELEAALAAAQARVERLREALQNTLGLIDRGYLVRDTSKDYEQGWALIQMKAVQVLSEAASLTQAEGDRHEDA